MPKRSDLSNAQQVKLLALSSFWSRQWASTAPADRPRAEAAVDEVYALAGYRPPKKRWMLSPLSAVVNVGDDMRHSIVSDLGTPLELGNRSIAEKHGYDLGELLGDRLTGQFIPVGVLSGEERTRIESRRLRPPSWHIRRINELIDHRNNVIFDFHGWAMYAQSVFLRGALDPFEVFAAEVLATVLTLCWSAGM